MSITGALVLFAVIWFMIFFVVLPIRFRSQADAGEVTRGTPASAPADEQVRRKAILTTAIAVVLWAVIAGVILSGRVTVRDIDWFGRMGPAGQGVAGQGVAGQAGGAGN